MLYNANLQNFIETAILYVVDSVSGFLALADGVDDGDDDHQEANLAVDAADWGMAAFDNPLDGGGYTAHNRQQEHPPQHAGDLVAVLGETHEPVALPVMEVYVVNRKNGQHHPQHYMHPYRPCVYAACSLKLYAGREDQEQHDLEPLVA